LFIEYQGEQHYLPCTFGRINKLQAEEKFYKQIIRDNNFRNYCNINNINLLEVDGRKYKGQLLIDYIEKYFDEFKLLIKYN